MARFVGSYTHISHAIPPLKFDYSVHLDVLMYMLKYEKQSCITKHAFKMS